MLQKTWKHRKTQEKQSCKWLRHIYMRKQFPRSKSPDTDSDAGFYVREASNGSWLSIFSDKPV